MKIFSIDDNRAVRAVALPFDRANIYILLRYQLHAVMGSIRVRSIRRYFMMERAQSGRFWPRTNNLNVRFSQRPQRSTVVVTMAAQSSLTPINKLLVVFRME